MSNQYRCSLIGGQSLLIQCGQRLLDAGHEIVRVVSSDPQVAEWAKSRELTLADDRGDLAAALTAEPVDYLFSIVNLRLLPAAVVDFPNRMAINFHDGPLPAYSGLNVTSWALLNQENSHGVSWHQITAGIDDGDLLASAAIDIAPQETAFSLNTKCFQAGIESFESLLSQLTNDDLKPKSQAVDQAGQYCAMRDRPESAGLLDWQQPGATLEKQVRALNYGPGYANAFAVAKISGPAGLLVVDEVKATAEPQSDAPGTLLGVDPQGLRIAVANGSIILTSCRLLNGESVPAPELLSVLGVAVGDRLSLPETDATDKSYRELCGQEGFWVDQWRQFEPTPNPCQLTTTKPATMGLLKRDYSAHIGKFNNDMPPGKILAAAWLLFWGRLADSPQISIALSTPTQRGHCAVQEAQLSELFAAWLPFNWQVDYRQPAVEVLTNGLKAFTVAEHNQSFLNDLFARQPTIQPQRQWLTGTLPLLVEQVDSGAQIGGSIRSVKAAVMTLQFSPGSGKLAWHYDEESIPPSVLETTLARFEIFLGSLATETEWPVGQLPLLTEADKTHLDRLRRKAEPVDPFCVHQLIEQQVTRTPDATALIVADQQWSYAELNNLADRFSAALAAAGAGPGERVGILLERSERMLVAMLAVLKSGAAYVPLDPDYPDDRLAYMAEDAGLVCMVTSSLLAENFDWLDIDARTLLLDDLANINDELKTSIGGTVASHDLAYMIYTSGSTGKPKGVMVEHRNVVNFFSGMDQRIHPEQGKVWLSVTSISFDISVLELFWTLSRGLTLVLYADKVRGQTPSQNAADSRSMDFSLFYWNQVAPGNDPGDYRLLFESAKFGDANGFSAVWTPERHFGSFGALYPNPALTSAAVAAITENIDVRAGSCVIPLHDPIRVAEEWAMIDRMSAGRVGIAVAAGWMPNDFVLQPENFAEAKQKMFTNLEIVRKLWRGEAIERIGPKGPVSVKTQPPPIQKELPIWITTAGSIDSFKRAGELGANLLTHLLGQTIEQVSEKIKIYRAAWRDAGHQGEGRVTLLLHTLVGNQDEVKEIVRDPMKRYLASAVSLVKDAAWEFPTYEKVSAETGQTLDDYFESVEETEMDALLDFAFERYYETSGLFGSVQSLLPRVNQLKKIGVDEIGCLIDFGVDDDTVLEHLPALNELKQAANKSDELAQLREGNTASAVNIDETIADLIVNHHVTHLQCTPSQASMLVADPVSAQALGNIKVMMVGGEALSADLARQLDNQVGGKVINMYGPTETTIWSSTYELGSSPIPVTLGDPISSTSLYLLDSRQQMLPPGVPGELVIGGAGVVRGYHQRESLTAERFLPDPFSADAKGGAADLVKAQDAGRMYRTGDQVVYSQSGALMFLGRIDFQVKLRGYRIELGEIEQVLRQHVGINDAICLVREDQPGDQQLVAYLVVAGQSGNDQFLEQELRALVGAHLPEFMCPGHYQFLPRWPLTPNGKADRLALPQPTRDLGASAEAAIAPAEGLETVIAAIWSEVLRRDQVGVNENFFDIGGHSLLVVQVLQKFRDQLSQPVQLTDLFRFPTIAGLAGHLQGGDGEPDAEVSASRARGEARRAGRGRRRRPG